MAQAEIALPRSIATLEDAVEQLVHPRSPLAAGETGHEFLLTKPLACEPERRLKVAVDPLGGASHLALRFSFPLPLRLRVGPSWIERRDLALLYNVSQFGHLIGSHQYLQFYAGHDPPYSSRLNPLAHSPLYLMAAMLLPGDELRTRELRATPPAEAENREAYGLHLRLFARHLGLGRENPIHFTTLEQAKEYNRRNGA